MSNTNLKKETLDFLEECGKTSEDVDFVVLDGKETYTDFEDFISFADKINYDSGYGGNEVPLNLKIVGDNWWLERVEYDGSEWWDYKSKPLKPLIKQSYKDSPIGFIAS